MFLVCFRNKIIDFGKKYWKRYLCLYMNEMIKKIIILFFYYMC